MSKRIESYCVCHHPESDHRKDFHGTTHCNGMREGVEFQQDAGTLPADALCGHTLKEF
jgi:hypothetical protein